MCCEGLFFTFSVSAKRGGGIFLFLTKEKMNENEFFFPFRVFAGDASERS